VIEADPVWRNLRPEWVSGRELRDRLNAGRWWWRRWSGPAFYAHMDRLVREGWAERMTRTVLVEGEPIQRTYFRAAPWDE